MSPSHPCTSLLTLPSELLSLIFNYLPEPQPYGSNQTLLSASKTCKDLRQMALPLLFDTVCCHIREERNVHHHALEKVVEHQILLRYVKTLHVKIPRYVTGREDKQLIDGPEADLAQLDLATIERGVAAMTHLRTVRYDGTIEHCLELLKCIPDKSIHIILGYVFSRHGRRQLATPDEMDLRNLGYALAGRHVSLGSLCSLRSSNGLASLREPLLEGLRRDNITLDSCSSLRVQNTIGSISPLKDTLSLVELVIDPVPDVASGNRASENLPLLESHRLVKAIPWNQLLRLCIHDSAQIQRMRPFNLNLPSLRSLSFRPEKDLDILLPYHSDCGPEARGASLDPSEHFGIDYSALPALVDLEIEGLCTHVPVQYFVGPKLRALKLHAPHPLASTMSAFSQRSPSDIAKIAAIAPDIDRLELDIGNIENLWHVTAIPGVDIDMEIYNILSMLARFKKLRTLRLFPSYVTRSTSAILGRFGRDPISRPLECQQPTTDPEAVSMFQRLRMTIPSLRQLSILPCPYFSLYIVPRVGPLSIVRTNDPPGFAASSWHISFAGEKTVLMTRQTGHSYSLRQVFIGQRRLTTSIHQHRFYNLSHVNSGGRLNEDSEWLLG